MFNELCVKEEKWKETAKSVIDSEVKIYDFYLRGEVYRYELFDCSKEESDESVDSCGGFYGDNLSGSGILDAVESSFGKIDFIE